MKRFFYAISIVLLLVGCSKEEPISHTTHTAPTPIMVTMQELIGTWVFEDATAGITEVIQFGDDNLFYFSKDLGEYVSGIHAQGSYQIGTNGKVNGGCSDKILDLTFFKMSDYSFTIKDNTNDEERIYGKLVGETLQLDYHESTLPAYRSWVDEEITSYKSHNDKTAIVDTKTGLITAMSEGFTVIDVVTSQGTAAVIVEAGGLIPDYAGIIGKTKEETKSAYGDNPTEEFEAYLLYRDEAKSVQFNFNIRTGKANGVDVKYGNYKGFSRNELVEYLNTKYYLHKKDSDRQVYINNVNYDKSTATITWDNIRELEYRAINRDLFEDFSIAIGKSRSEIEHLYGEDLALKRETSAELEYEIDEDLLEYAGVDKMKTVKFTFGNNVVVSVRVRLKNLTKDEITNYLETRYGTSIGNDDEAVYYFDQTTGIEIAYRGTYDEIEYYTR